MVPSASEARFGLDFLSQGCRAGEYPRSAWSGILQVWNLLREMSWSERPRCSALCLREVCEGTEVSD